MIPSSKLIWMKSGFFYLMVSFYQQKEKEEGARPQYPFSLFGVSGSLVEDNSLNRKYADCVAEERCGGRGGGKWPCSMVNMVKTLVRTGHGLLLWISSDAGHERVRNSSPYSRH